MLNGHTEINFRVLLLNLILTFVPVAQQVHNIKAYCLVATLLQKCSSQSLICPSNTYKHRINMLLDTFFSKTIFLYLINFIFNFILYRINMLCFFKNLFYLSKTKFYFTCYALFYFIFFKTFIFYFLWRFSYFFIFYFLKTIVFFKWIMILSNKLIYYLFIMIIFIKCFN